MTIFAQRITLQDKFEKRVEDTLLSLTKRVQKIEDEAAKERDRNAAAFEVKYTQLINKIERLILCELRRLRHTANNK